MKTERNQTIDIIKGIAIILMVYGHTFGVLRNWVYLFHMPVFFFVCGYCWNTAHSSSKSKVSDYLFERTKRLLLPYFAVIILVTLLRNCFVEINFYSNNPEFVHAVQNAPISQYNVDVLPIRTTFMNCYLALCFQYEPPQLAGSMWFLYALFMVEGVHCILEYIFAKCKNSRIRTALWMLLFFLLCIIGWAVSMGYGFSLAIRHRRLPAAYSCLLLGYYYKKLIGKYGTQLQIVRSKIWNRAAFKILFAVVSCVGLVQLNKYGVVELSEGIITNPFFLCMCTLLGWIGLKCIAELIPVQSLKNSFAYIGRHTLSIVMMHLFAFKLFSCCIVWLSSMPSFMIASYPILFDISETLKIMYTCIGVVFPLLIARGVETIKASRLKTTNILS